MKKPSNDSARPKPKPRRGAKAGAPAEAEARPVELQRYRVEGVSRNGAILYVKVTGRPRAWVIRGLGSLHMNVRGETVHDALRLARQKIPFTPIVIREITDNED